MQSSEEYDYLVCGYYGMSNSGDDALQKSVWHGLHNLHQAKHGPDQTPSVAVTARTSAWGTPILPAEQKFRGHDRLALYNAARKSQHIVFGGGSTLHSFRDIQLKRHLISLARGNGHFAVGIGVGPFSDERTFLECKKLLESMAFVGVRDQDSLRICQSMQLSTPVVQTGDLVPSLSGSLDFAEYDQPLPKRRGIGISLCPLESIKTGDTQKEEARVAALAKIINEVARYSDEPVVLIDFNGHEELGDSGLHNLMQKALSPNVKVERLYYEGDPVRYFQEIGRLRCMVGMRLHAQIFAYLVGTPLISLEYHSKNAGFSREIGLDQSQRFDVEQINFDELFLSLLGGLAHGFKPPKAPVADTIKNSILNWRCVNAYA